MSASVTFALVTEDEVFDFIYALDNPRPYERELVERAVRRGFENNFNEQGSWAPWTALAPYTVRDRIRHGFSGTEPILVRTGRFRRTWTNYFMGVREFELTASGWELSIGSGIEMAIWHEEGTPNMPARPVAYLNESDLAHLDRTISEWMSAVEMHP